MNIWVVRSGYNNRHANTFLSEGIIAIDYDNLGNLSLAKDIGKVEEIYLRGYEDEVELPGRKAFQVAQIWRFLKEIKVGDYALLPLKAGTVWIGEVKGHYYYSNEEPFHRRKVEWIKQIEKKSLDQDLYYSLGATLSIFKMQKRNVNERILKAFGLPESKLVQ